VGETGLPARQGVLAMEVDHRWWYGLGGSGKTWKNGALGRLSVPGSCGVENPLPFTHCKIILPHTDSGKWVLGGVHMEGQAAGRVVLGSAQQLWGSVTCGSLAQVAS
jgi:hypothetical protein